MSKDAPMIGAALGRTLLLRADSTLWLWPHPDRAPEALRALVSAGAGTGPDGADVAVLVVTSKQEFTEAMATHLAELAGIRAVWLAYPKGNRADINRDSLWIALGDYGWRAVSNVAVDEEHSAIRIRPLEAGEAPRTA